MPLPIPVLYRDEDLLVVNKPPGLLVHRTPLDPHETESLVTRLWDQLAMAIHPLHRLDRPTSGVLVAGLSQRILRPMSEAFAAGEVDKTYLALVRGWPEDEGIIDHPLRDLEDRRGRKIREGSAREALTGYRTLERFEFPLPFGGFETTRCALVEVTPKTGRYRQIRRHFKHIFHPLIGDTTFGDGKVNRHFRDHFACHRLMLHARAVAFTHPVTGALLYVEAPVDALFTDPARHRSAHV